PRPSSPLTAKASTVCAYSLDHITPSRLGITQPVVANINDIQMLGTRSPRLSLNDTFGYSSQTLATSLVFKEHGPATVPIRFKIFMCAQKHPGWWVWEDSNHRPHPYQGCALTT